MSPVAVAVVGVLLVFAVFWATAGMSSGAAKWTLRIASLVVAYLLSAALSSDSRAAAAAGQYLVYLGVPAIVVYLIARAMVGGRR